MVDKALEVFDGRIDILVNVAGVTGSDRDPGAGYRRRRLRPRRHRERTRHLPADQVRGSDHDRPERGEDRQHQRHLGGCAATPCAPPTAPRSGRCVASPAPWRWSSGSTTSTSTRCVPGIVDGPRMQKLCEEKAHVRGWTAEEVYDEYVQDMALKRVTVAQDIANRGAVHGQRRQPADHRPAHRRRRRLGTCEGAVAPRIGGRAMHAPFELEMPGDLAGALNILAAGGDSKTVPIAGGTNLIVDMRARRERPDRVVGLGAVGELRGMEFGPDRITIGGGTTVTDLLESPGIAEAAPSLRRFRAPVRGPDGAQQPPPWPATSPAGLPPLISCRRCSRWTRTSRWPAPPRRAPPLPLESILPRLQARRATGRRADHPGFLAAPARAVGQHLLQARSPQGRRDHRHRRGTDARLRRRRLHDGAHRARRGGAFRPPGPEGGGGPGGQGADPLP